MSSSRRSGAGARHIATGPSTSASASCARRSMSARPTTRSSRRGSESATSLIRSPRPHRSNVAEMAPTEPRERLLNRELSFVDVCSRVLEMGADEAVPLLERVKFLAISSMMVDEFFMLRVAGLLGQEASGVSVRSPDGRTPHETLGEIRERVIELSTRQSRVWSRELAPALGEQGILIGNVDDCT